MASNPLPPTPLPPTHRGSAGAAGTTSHQGARRRTGTPGPAVQKPNSAGPSQESTSRRELPPRRPAHLPPVDPLLAGGTEKVVDRIPKPKATGGSSQQQARPFLWALALFVGLLGLGFLGLGLGIWQRQGQSRAERIGVFRELLRRTPLPALPLPTELLQQPPAKLLASWRLPSPLDAEFMLQEHDFELSLLEVPLSPELLSDRVDEDDERPLPIHQGREATMDYQQDLPSELRRSRLYRASVPADRLLPNEVLHGTSSNISLEEGLAGLLEVYLPDGRLLLRHTLETLRWKQTAAQGVDQHALARLCYALPPDDGPWDGALVSDCEHGRGNPVYLPRERFTQEGGREIEVVLRGRMDPYVHASEVTRGCTNCFGKAYGNVVRSDPALSCGRDKAPGAIQWMLSWIDPTSGPGHCFGLPLRRFQAQGFFFLSLAFLVAGVDEALSRQRSQRLKLFAGLSSLLLLSAIAAHTGLPGKLWRWSHSLH